MSRKQAIRGGAIAVIVGLLFVIQPIRWWLFGKPADLQLAGLVEKSVRKAGPSLFKLGVDPQAIHLHTDCSQTSSGHNITYYGCFAYLSEGPTSLPIQYEGYVRANGEMEVWPRGHSPQHEEVERLRSKLNLSTEESGG
jgi:hypothetical protein